MAFQHRKFLEKPKKIDEKYATTPCYMCYICPDDCSSYLSPPPPPHPPTQKHQVPTILILMLCVLSAAFVLLSYLTIIRYRLRRRNSRLSSLRNGVFRENFVDENQGPILDHHVWFIRTVGLPQSVIDSIAVFRYKDGEGLIEGRDCSVCLNEFEEGESLRLLPKCSHAFHLPCIDTWLRSHKNCPVCRAPVLINTDTDSNTGRVGSVVADPGSGPSEENRTVVEPESGESIESRGVVENRDVMVLKDRFRVVSDLADRHRVSVDRDLNPVRRSFSMDFSIICMKKDEESSGVKMEKQNLEMMAKRASRNTIVYNNKLTKSYLHGLSVQKGSVHMKKSLSFSGKGKLQYLK